MTNEKFSFLSWAAPLAKLFLVPVALWLIGRNFWNAYPSSAISVNIFLISLAVIFNQIALSLFAARMRIMLKVFGINISGVQSLRIHLQSVLYFFVLPMTVGLEAARFAKVRHIVGSNAQALTLGSALLADRLIGAIAALILAASLLPFINLNLMSQWNTYSTLALVIGCGVLILIAYLYKGSRTYFHEAGKLIYCGQKGLWLTLAVSISTHLVFAFGVYLAVIAAHLEITFIQTLFCVSAAMLFVIVPVSFAGVSPVEGATFGVLLSLGISVEQALIFVFISYSAKLIAAFEGAGWEVYEGGKYVFRLLPQVNKDKP
jgi:uncharacterized membrane protein YbhN (UPF0104 family)